jgi:hypothetical protein
VKKLFAYLLSLMIGIVMMSSAWFKLFPIEPFEYKIVATTFISWVPAVFVARLVIALEFFLGLLLIFTYDLKRSLKWTIATLIVFSLHLTIDLLLNGNASDCGCMGSLMQFTPLQGILKNLVLIGMALLAYQLAYSFVLPLQHLPYYLFLVSAMTIFIVNPIDLSYSERYLNQSYKVFELNLDTLYQTSTHGDKVQAPVEDIRQKQLILAFVSASCPHCKIAAQKIAAMRKQNPQLPFYFFINGDDDKIQLFLRNTETSDVPHSRLNGPLFVQMAGLNLPIIYYYNKGKIERQVDYFTLEQYHVEAWLNKKD